MLIIPLQRHAGRRAPRHDTVPYNLVAPVLPPTRALASERGPFVRSSPLNNQLRAQVQLRKWIRNMDALERAAPSAKCLTASRISHIEPELHSCDESLRSSPPTTAVSPTHSVDDTKPFSLSSSPDEIGYAYQPGISAPTLLFSQQPFSRLAVHPPACHTTVAYAQAHRWSPCVPAAPLPSPQSIISSEEMAARELINMSFA